MAIGAAAAIAVMIIAGFMAGKGCKGRRDIKHFFYPLGIWVFKRLSVVRKKREYRKTNITNPLLNAEEHIEREFARKTSIVMMLIILICIILILINAVDKTEEVVANYGIIRNEPGLTVEKVELIASYNGGDVYIEADIPSIPYSENDVYKFIKNAEEYIISTALGGNASWDSIDRDLNFVSEVPDNPVNVSWKVEDLTLISRSGRIIAADIPESGIKSSITAVLELQGIEKEICIDYTLVHHVNENYDVENALKDAIIKANADNESGEVYILPKIVDGKEYTWRENKSNTALKIIPAGILGIAVLIIFWKREFKNRMARRKAELEADYPLFVHQLVLYLRAGMNIQKSLGVIKKDYERDKDRFLYQEICVCLRAIDKGIMQAKAYEMFGKRCGTDSFLKLGSMLVQYLHTGAKGMNDMLEQLAQEASSMHKETIKQKSETAGMRLLIPLMMLLIVVMTVVLYPALSSMSL